MIDERLAAVRKVREEADNLRLACIAAAPRSALLHVAFDHDFVQAIPLDETVLLGRLGGTPQ